MILKTNRDFFHNNNKLGLGRISLRPCSNRKHCQGIDAFLHIKLFFFQLATGGIERAVYKKMIAPFKNDLPTSLMDGLRRVCAEYNYAYFGPNILDTIYSLSLPCQLVPLPGTSHRDPWAFIISKNSSYKGLINWR
jgi:hypothetical protein